jgi:hypothetical protein
LVIFFIKWFLLISFIIHLLETSPQKQKEQRQQQLDFSFFTVFSLPAHFEFFAILHCQVCLLVKETAEIETEMKSPAGTRQTYGKN